LSNVTAQYGRWRGRQRHEKCGEEKFKLVLRLTRSFIFFPHGLEKRRKEEKATEERGMLSSSL